MIDLETLGRRPGCVILSIGAVYFNLEENQIFTEIRGGTFYSSIKLESSVNAGLTIESDTLLWWLQQDGDARKYAFSGNNYLIDTLSLLESFLKPSVWIWAKGPAFDIAILEEVYKIAGYSPPWNFRQVRCVRTIENLVSRLAGLERPYVLLSKEDLKLIEHYPLDDAIYQAYQVNQAFNFLKTLR